MALTKSDCEKIKIPTAEIERDIKITQSEIDQFKKELVPLKQDPVNNKLDIYVREGRIAKRVGFVEKLKTILKYRNEES